MPAPRRPSPAILSTTHRLAILAGYFLTAGIGAGLLANIDHIRWFDQLNGFVIAAILIFPILAFSVWAARRHCNFAFAVFGPAVGAVAASLIAVTTAEFENPNDELAPWVVVILLVPIFSLGMWVPTALGGVAAVRYLRGRWQRTRIGICPSCGYDLAGLQRKTCPECGSDCTTSLP